MYFHKPKARGNTDYWLNDSYFTMTKCNKLFITFLHVQLNAKRLPSSISAISINGSQDYVIQVCTV